MNEGDLYPVETRRRRHLLRALAPPLSAAECTAMLNVLLAALRADQPASRRAKRAASTFAPDSTTPIRSPST